MSLPQIVIAAGWVPFVVVVVLVVIFASLYINYFKSKHDSELSSTITAILGLCVALFTLILIPVDVFLVSFMKDSNGTFKDWATDLSVREDLKDSMLYTYYTLYLCMFAFMFFILPFVYFYYEAGDEITTRGGRICGALKYTTGFLLVASVLVLMGSLIPLKDPPPVNSTDWDKIEFVVHELGNNKAEDIFSFVLSILTVVGMALLIVFAGYGMSALPCAMIKGRNSVDYDRDEVRDKRVVLERRATDIRDKYAGSNQRMTSRDQSALFKMEEELRLLDRQERYLDAMGSSVLNKCFTTLRPCEMVGGIALTILGFLVFLSLLLTNIDKALHSLGMKMGYQLVKRQIPNPIDIIFVYAEMVFPIDYVLFAGIVLFLVFCSMSALRRTGIWFLWIRMYRIRPGRTAPQGLLMMVLTMMLVILALNVVLYALTPQYMTFGSQQYWTTNSSGGGGAELLPCSLEAPPESCGMSRMSLLLLRYFYKAWIFGAIYYWASWFFLVVIVLGSIVSTFKQQSLLDDSVNRDDFDESDDDDPLLNI